MARISILSMLIVLAARGIGSAELVRLGYDDGSVEDAIWMDELRGHAVIFDAPADNWTLSAVEILGSLVPETESEMFVVEVWDRNLSLVSRSTDRARSYFSGNLSWSIVDMPDARVSGSFIVSVYEFAGIYVGVDNSSISQRSILTARNPNRILNWDMANRSYNETSWMIRALGSSPAPQVSLEVAADRASQASPADIRVTATDADDNLNIANFYVMNNETKEIVWSEVKTLEGGKAELEFSWPGTVRQLSINGSDYGPLLAANALGISENISSLLAYSAPAILFGENNTTASALAYFGQEGMLHLLLDSFGGAYYLSSDLLSRTMPASNYSQYAQENISLVAGESMIGFLKMIIPANGSVSGTEVIGPLLLTDSPENGYGLRLVEANAEAGEYIMLVEVQDTAYNLVGRAGDTAVVVA